MDTVGLTKEKCFHWRQLCHGEYDSSTGVSKSPDITIIPIGLLTNNCLTEESTAEIQLDNLLKMSTYSAMGISSSGWSLIHMKILIQFILKEMRGSGIFKHTSVCYDSTMKKLLFADEGIEGRYMSRPYFGHFW